MRHLFCVTILLILASSTIRASATAPPATVRDFSKAFGSSGPGNFDAQGRRLLISGSIYEARTGKFLAHGVGRLSDDGTRTLLGQRGHAILRILDGEQFKIEERKAEWHHPVWVQDSDLYYVCSKRDNPKYKPGRKPRKGEKPSIRDRRHLWTLEKWDLRAQKRLAKADLDLEPLAMIASDDGQSVLVLTSDGGLLYSTRSLKKPKRHDALAGVKRLTGSIQDGRVVIDAKREYDVERRVIGKPKGGLDGRPTAILSPDGKTVSAYESFAVTYYPKGKPGEAKTFRPRDEFPSRITSPLADCRYLPDEGRYLFLNRCGTVTSFDPSTGKSEVLWQLPVHTGVITSLECRGDLLVTSDTQGRVMARRRSNAELAWRYECGNKQRPVLAGNRVWGGFWPTGEGGRGTTGFRVFGIDLESGEKGPPLTSRLDGIRCGGGSADGSIVALAGSRRVEVYDGKRDEFLFGVDGPVVHNVAVDPSGRRLFILNEGQMVVHDVATQELLSKIEGRFGNHEIHVDPDGQWLITSSLKRKSMTIYTSHVLTEWNVDTLEKNWSLDIKGGGRFAVSPDGRHLLIHGVYEGRGHPQVIDRAKRKHVWGGEPKTLPHQGLDRYVWSEEGSIYFVDKDGRKVQVIDLPEGAPFN